MKIKSSLCFSFLLLLHASLTNAMTTEDRSKLTLKKGPYEYTYDSVRSAPDDFHGVIKVVNIRSGDVLFQEARYPPAGCDSKDAAQFAPGITEFAMRKPGPQWGDINIVVFCGSDEGRTVLSIFWGDQFVVRIPFDNESPNLIQIDNDLTLETVITPRLDTDSSLARFIFVLDVNLAQQPQMLRPVFNDRTRQFYRKFFEEIKKNAKDYGQSTKESFILEPLLAALVATQDKPFICSQIGSSTFSGIAKETINGVIAKNEKKGYPMFDFESECKQL